jgi:hypothetical protein
MDAGKKEPPEVGYSIGSCLSSSLVLFASCRGRKEVGQLTLINEISLRPLAVSSLLLLVSRVVLIDDYIYYLLMI